MEEKIKGLRLKGKLLKWWEENNDAPDKVREFIKSQAEKDQYLGEISKAPPELLKEMSNMVKVLQKSESISIQNKDRLKETESKIDNLINMS